jgi:hypothetical protein
LRGQREGEAHLIFADWATKAQMFYAVPEKAKALRVHRFLPVPGVTKSTEARDRVMLELTSRLKDKDWTADGAATEAKAVPEITAMMKSIKAAKTGGVEMAAAAIVAIGKVPVAKTATAADAKSPTEVKKSYGVSDNFEELDVPAPRAVPGAPLLSPAERAGLPPMYQGDEFAIEDLESAPAYAASGNGNGYVTQGTAGFGGTDMDLAAVIPSFGEDEEIEDIAAIQLPDDITAILAQSAQKLNEGLRGKRA